MQRHKLIITVCLFLSFSCGYSQNPREIKLKDSVLLKALRNFIDEAKTKNETFKTYGHVEMKLIYFNANELSHKNIISYRIIDQYYNLGSKQSLSTRIPETYTYVKDKIVFFFKDDRLHLQDLDEKQLKKNKRKISRLLRPYMQEPEHIKVRDSTGKIIINDREFRPDEAFNIHGGIILDIYRDGTYEIKYR